MLCRAGLHGLELTHQRVAGNVQSILSANLTQQEKMLSFPSKAASELQALHERNNKLSCF